MVLVPTSHGLPPSSRICPLKDVEDKNDLEWGSRKWATDTEALAQEVVRACLAAARDEDGKFLRLITSAIEAAFEAPSGAAFVNLSRFATLRELLFRKVVPELFRAQTERVKEFTARAVTALIDASYKRDFAALDPVQYIDLQQAITGCVLRHVVDLVDRKLPLCEGIPAEFRLEEDSMHADLRVAFNGRLEKLVKAKETIENINI